LEEDLLKDFVEKRNNNELLSQKTPTHFHKILRPIELSRSTNGNVSFGDVVCLYHPQTEENLTIFLTNNQLYDADVASTPCGVTSSKMLKPLYRNAFAVANCDGSDVAHGEPLRYGQKFVLTTLPGIVGDLKLSSERATLYKSAKKSRHNEVTLTSNVTYGCCWHVLHFDPQQRLESEGTPVPVNTKVIIMHSKTNEGLAALEKYRYSTPFGKEHEVAAHTFLDSHKAEQEENHWCFVVSVNETDW